MLEVGSARFSYRVALFLTLIVYGTALFLPGVFYKSDPDLQGHLGRPIPAIDYGFQMLEWGWAGVFIGNFAWLANMFGPAAFIIALISARGSEVVASAFCALFAFALSLNAFSFDRKPLDESGANWAHVDHFGSGFYLWEASFLLLAVTIFAKYLSVTEISPGK